MIRDVLAIETGDLVFPIIFEVATSREYHAARELYGARFKHISLAISDIDTKFYLISTICRYIFIIIRIPETSPHDVNPRHSRFSVLQLKFSKGRQKIWYILVINLQSYFGELWHIIPKNKGKVNKIMSTLPSCSNGGPSGASAQVFAKRRKNRAEKEEHTGPSTVPLAIPLISGSGSIATIILLTGQNPGVQGIASACAVMLAAMAVLFLFILAGGLISTLYIWQGSKARIAWA